MAETTTAPVPSKSPVTDTQKPPAKDLTKLESALIDTGWEAGTKNPKKWKHARVAPHRENGQWVVPNPDREYTAEEAATIEQHREETAAEHEKQKEARAQNLARALAG
jgi:hypothetical protein